MFPTARTVHAERTYMPGKVTCLFLSVFNHILYIYIYILIKIPSYNNNICTYIRHGLYVRSEMFIRGFKNFVIF